MIIISSVLGGCICICGFIISNLLIKVERTQEGYEELETSTLALYQAITSCLAEMERIDDRGVFQSDDETGAVFNQLKEVIKQTSGIVYDSSKDGSNE